jgi:uncharacterized protein YecT (DUF1311 family)
MRLKTYSLFGCCLFLGMCLSSIAFAKTQKEYQDIYDQCVDQAGTINNGVVEACTSQTSDRVKKDINRLYGIFYKRLQSEHPYDVAAFEASQKAWLDYRNQHCLLMGSYVGSPMHGYCPMTLNIERALELQELVGN